MKLFFKNIIDIIFPPKCLICEEMIHDMGGLCSECWVKIDFTSEPACSICNYPFPYEATLGSICGYCVKKRPIYDRAYSVFRYNEHSKILLHRFKYGDKTFLAPYFAQWILRSAGKSLESADFLVPVPLYYKKLYSRLYNQSALLAMHLSKYTNIKFLPLVLQKTKDTSSQTGLEREKRLKNVINSFSVDNNYLDLIKGKNIVLIDDVMTTGATINECSKILLSKGKAAKITVITLARTVI
jgi:ComF family protein